MSPKPRAFQGRSFAGRGLPDAAPEGAVSESDAFSLQGIHRTLKTLQVR